MSYPSEHTDAEYDALLIRAETAEHERDAYREVVAKAEVWRHWWLLTHGRSFTFGGRQPDPRQDEMVKLIALRDAAEIDLEEAVGAVHEALRS